MDGINYLKNLAPWKGWGSWGLENMVALMQALGNPQDKYKTFHIAGTNGKGSVSATISSIFGAGGNRVVLNSSPHLVTINERIVVDGLPISDEVLDRLLIKVRDAAASGNIVPSHFEAITAAAFQCCADMQPAIGVVEVGLGGRLDATNVIKAPEACAIVTIDFDHEALLGDTIAKIAGEKAGIVKPKVPIVIGNMGEEAQWVIQEKARNLGAKIYQYGIDFQTEAASNCYIFRSRELGTFEFRPALEGEHQVHNTAVAIAMARLGGASVSEIQEGIRTVYWPARLEHSKFQDLEFIIDSAHNPAGIAALISFLNTHSLRNIDFVFGALKSKRWHEMIEALKPFVARWNLLTPDFPEAVQADEIADYLSGFGIKARSYGHNYSKLLTDLTHDHISSPVVVAGSMYMVGKLKGEMRVPIPRLWSRKGE